MNVIVHRARVTIIRHASAVIFIGLIAGFSWTFALLEKVQISPIPIVFSDGFFGDPGRWRVVHLGCITNGLMALGFAAAMGQFELKERQAKSIMIASLITIWGNLLFYVASVFAPNRGLNFGSNAVGSGSVAGNIAYSGAMFAAFAALYITWSFLRFRSACSVTDGHQR